MEFLTQAILRILHFKLENTFPANGTTIQKVEKLFSIFSAKEADRQDVKSSIDEFKRINDISLEFGPYPATIFAKDLFLKLNSKYTISQSDNHDSLMKSLAIKRHLIRPSDLSSKWWSFCETIRSIQSTFDNQDSFARIVVCTQSRQSAHVIQKLVEDLSDMFDIGVCDVADENHMDEQDLGSKKCSLLVLEKDVFDSVELYCLYPKPIYLIASLGLSKSTLFCFLTPTTLLSLLCNNFDQIPFFVMFNVLPWSKETMK